MESPIPQSGDKNGLRPVLGLVAFTVYGLGDILGAGIYSLIGRVAGEVGNAVWLVFVGAFMCAGLTGLSYASLGSRFPKAAGEAFIAQRAFGSQTLSRIVGLVVILSGVVAMATVCRAFAGYLSGVIPGIPAGVAIACLVLTLTLINLWGIRQASWANMVCTAIELGGLLLIIAVGMASWGDVNYLNMETVENPTGEFQAGVFLSACVLAFFAFIGFEDMINVSEEVKDAKRVFPIAMILALVIATVVYIAVGITAVSVVSARVLGESVEPLVDVIQAAAPWFPSVVFSVIAMFAITNTALLNYIMSSRLAYGMAKQGLIPSIFARLLPRARTPIVAILALGAIALLLSISSDLSVLARVASALVLMVFIVVNASLITLNLRGDEDESNSSFRVPIAVPILGGLACVVLLFYVPWQSLATALSIVVALALLGLAGAMGRSSRRA